MSYVNNSINTTINTTNNTTKNNSNIINIKNYNQKIKDTIEKSDEILLLKY